MRSANRGPRRLARRRAGAGYSLPEIHAASRAGSDRNFLMRSQDHHTARAQVRLEEFLRERDRGRIERSKWLIEYPQGAFGAQAQPRERDAAALSLRQRFARQV